MGEGIYRIGIWHPVQWRTRVKGGQLTVVQQKPFSIENIHAWTSAFMIYMGIMFEKWPNKGQEYLKYMYNVRLAAERGSGTGWILYDEQYRLLKVRPPFSLWGEVDMELWLLYVATQDRTFPNPNTNSSDGNPSLQRKAPFPAGNRGPQKVRTCWGFNKGNCHLTKHIDSPTSVRTALVPTHFLTAGPKNSTHDLQLYSLADSPICFNEVDKSLINYPSQDVTSN
jgi:hypothetical protein